EARFRVPAGRVVRIVLRAKPQKRGSLSKDQLVGLLSGSFQPFVPRIDISTGDVFLESESDLGADMSEGLAAVLSAVTNLGLVPVREDPTGAAKSSKAKSKPRVATKSGEG